MQTLAGRKRAASACASATVVNAIAAGRGATFAIDLRVRAEVELTGRPGEVVGRVADDPAESPKLIEICARKVLKQLKLHRTYGAEVTTRSEVPIAVGLSSSSAAANATVLATFAALGRKPRPRVALNLGIDAALEAGVTITGAFDDAAASYLGGGVITDNLERRILRRFRIDPVLRVLIHVPPSRLYTSQINVPRVKLIAELVDAAHKRALTGDIYGALTINGLLYSRALGHDPAIAIEAMRAGALAAGLTGTGPAVVALARQKSIAGIKRAWQGRAGKIIVTKASPTGACIEAGA